MNNAAPSASVPSVSPDPYTPAIEALGASPEGRQPASPEGRQVIAEAAYYRAEHRGFEPGHELEDWLAAEQEITAANARR